MLKQGKDIFFWRVGRIAVNLSVPGIFALVSVSLVTPIVHYCIEIVAVTLFGVKFDISYWRV